MNRRPANPVLILPALLLFSGAALADAPVASGLLAEYFDFGGTSLSAFHDLSGLVPDALRVEAAVNHPSTNGAWDGLDPAAFTDRFAARFSGVLAVPADGTYSFALSSDDGSRLYIDGNLVADHGGIHGMGRKTGSAALTEGLHDLLLLYFENDGGAGLTLSWWGPGFAEETIPPSALGHLPAAGSGAPAVKVSSPGNGSVGRAGDPVILTAAAWDGDGPAAAHYEYAPFGEVTFSSGDLDAANPFRFSSEYADDTLGLVYYNYRHLNPLDGRWFSRDLLFEFGGDNLYEFCYNNPTLFVDVQGKHPALILALIGILFYP